MGKCIICGTSADGPICDIHQEDVVFDFRGNSANQLVEGRFYRGEVDGYADFGVFVDLAPGVTGLLHRSKIDRRLESLDWEVGDDVFVQVTNVRDNGDVDLGWSIRQEPREFRGVLIQEPEGDRLPDDDEVVDDKPSAQRTTVSAGTSGSETETESGGTDDGGPDHGGSESDGGRPATEQERSGADAATSAASDDDAAVEAAADKADRTVQTTEGAARGGEAGSQRGGSERTGSQQAATEAEAADGAEETEAAAETDEAESGAEETTEYERVEVETLRERVGDDVRLEGEVVSVRQTSGPTVFELRDETGVVDCAAFEEAGVRAYPEVETGDVVRLDGEVRVRRDELQIETEGLVVLEGEEREAVEGRMQDALDAEARPEEFEQLADDDVVAALVDDVEDVATTIRRAVLESRPVVVRHNATTDGYVAGAAIERAVLPLVREEHAQTDAAYHYFDRRPLEDGVYDMDDATNDVTRMLDNRERHDEKLPLFVFAATGSTQDSLDGIELLGVYGAETVVVDGVAVDDEVAEAVDAAVSDDGERTASTLAANVAAATNPDVRDDLLHLPAVSYWEAVPASYDDIATENGVNPEAARKLREAVALEAYYQSYEDKRELIIDLLFEQQHGLAEQVSEQFNEKLDAELETAEANLETREVDGTTFTVLDTDSYTHRFDFPPTHLLLDALHRRHRDDAPVTVGVAKDELHLRATEPVDVAEVAEAAREAVPNAGLSSRGARTGKMVFLSGERDAVLDAVLSAVADRL